MDGYPKTINGIYQRAFERRADGAAYFTREADGWHATSWDTSRRFTEELALGLTDLGVTRGQVVGILMPTRPEWSQCDCAVLGLGAITVGLYTTATGDQMAYQLRHSEARVLIAEDEALLTPLLPHLADLPDLHTLVLRRGGLTVDVPQAITSLDALAARGRPARERDPDAFRRTAMAIQPDDVATYIYTSGTTGLPKGVILTHANFHGVVEAVQQAMPMEPGRVGVAFLPMAHSFQRFIAYQGACFGAQAYFAPSLDKVPETLQEVKPELFGAVPRILEKLYTRVNARVAAGSPVQRRLFAMALGVGSRRAAHLKAGTPVPWLLQRQFALADKVVFSKVKAVLGGRVERIASGGAPLAPHIAEFFLAMGILVQEGYGLTETSAATCTNLPGAFKFGTVGRPLPGSEAAIAPDGEILLKGPGVFRGYLKDPAATAEAFTPDGWFKTGDIGALDADGFLRITDRKKEIIVTAGGKNVAPQPIENALKGIRWVSNALVHGDRRKHLVALMTLDAEELADHFRAAGKPVPADLSADGDVRALVAAAVEEVNRGLAGYETIKRFALLPGEFTPEKGDLTPTLKLKRKVLEERHRVVLDSLYDGD